MKNISILGSTGSIGTQTLDVVRHNRDKFNVLGISGNHNIALLEKQVKEFNPVAVAVMDDQKALELKQRISGNRTEILCGLDGLIQIATLPGTDLLLTSIVGMIGLIPTIKAIQAKIDIALANKETLVTAGQLVMEEARKNHVRIIPVDSEHSAIFQCLVGYEMSDIHKIILTASGGPFRGYTKDQLQEVSLSQALNHPKWRMGKKITIDSATLMNKGLEVIEAKWLFDLDIEQIQVVIHPQSIIHSLVEYKDSSTIAQLGYPDMRVPIQYALTYPKRIENQYRKLDLVEISTLTFEKPDTDVFPCLRLAYDVLKMGKSYSTVLNAANEVLVDDFLMGKISFCDIPRMIEYVLERHNAIDLLNADTIIEIDRQTRESIKTLIK